MAQLYLRVEKILYEHSSGTSLQNGGYSTMSGQTVDATPQFEIGQFVVGL